MKKVAKLVSFTFTTRVIVDEDMSTESIVGICKPKILEKIKNDELSENLERVEDDLECPCGTFDTDVPVIEKVILSTTEKKYVVIGKGLPIQVVKFDNYSDWSSVYDDKGSPLFDVQIDFDDSVQMDNTDKYYQFQYVNLNIDEEGTYTTGLDYNLADQLIITKEPIANILLDVIKEL